MKLLVKHGSTIVSRLLLEFYISLLLEATLRRSGWSVHFAVGRPGVQFPCRVISKDFKKLVSTAFLLDARHLGEVVENKPASSLVVSLGKAVNGTPPSLCGRQVAQTHRKWQPSHECDRSVQNIATQFAFS